MSKVKYHMITAYFKMKETDFRIKTRNFRMDIRTFKSVTANTWVRTAQLKKRIAYSKMLTKDFSIITMTLNRRGTNLKMIISDSRMRKTNLRETITNSGRRTLNFRTRKRNFTMRYVSWKKTKNVWKAQWWIYYLKSRKQRKLNREHLQRQVSRLLIIFITSLSKEVTLSVEWFACFSLWAIARNHPPPPQTHTHLPSPPPSLLTPWGNFGGYDFWKLKSGRLQEIHHCKVTWGQIYAFIYLIFLWFI